MTTGNKRIVDCTMCDDTGFKDHAWLRMEPCDHQRPAREEVSGEEVERVARAICKSRGRDPSALVLNQADQHMAQWMNYRTDAWAAIAAMNPKPAEAEELPTGDPDRTDCDGPDGGGRFANPARPAEAAAEPKWRVEVLDGANSHVFDLRLCIDGDDSNCIAFADDPWATRIAYALRHADPANAVEVTPEQSETLHQAMIASMDEITPPASDAANLREAWDWLAQNTSHELSYEGWEEDEWHVHRVNGPRSDREWTLIARGETPLAAIQAAMALAAHSEEPSA